MPNTRAPAISPLVVCSNGDFSKLQKLLSEQIQLNKSTRIFIPLTPTAIRNAKKGKLSENDQIARLQKIALVAFEHGLNVVSAYDEDLARRGQKQMNEKKKGSQRTNFEIEHDMALAQYGPGNSGNPALEILYGKKHYFDTLAAVDGGLKKIIKANPGPRSIIIARPFFAAYILEVLRIPKKRYHGVSPHGKVPKKPIEIVLAEKYLASIPKIRKIAEQRRSPFAKGTQAKVRNTKIKGKLARPQINRQHH